MADINIIKSLEVFEMPNGKHAFVIAFEGFTSEETAQEWADAADAKMEEFLRSTGGEKIDLATGVIQ